MRPFFNSAACARLPCSGVRAHSATYRKGGVKNMTAPASIASAPYGIIMQKSWSTAWPAWLSCTSPSPSCRQNRRVVKCPGLRSPPCFMPTHMHAREQVFQVTKNTRPSLASRYASSRTAGVQTKCMKQCHRSLQALVRPRANTSKNPRNCFRTCNK